MKNRNRIPLSLGMLFISIALSQACRAQAPERWERLGPVIYSSISAQSASTLAMTTTHGFLYVSHDYGHSWEHRYIDDTLCLEGVKFVDSLHGVLISYEGTVLFTSDGGIRWRRSQISSVGLSYIACPSVDTTYVSDREGVIWRSTNQGSSWEAETFGLSTQPLNAIYFFDDRNGFVIGNAGFFAKTTDAGEHWASQDIGAGDSADLYSIDFYNRKIGIVGSGLRYAYITTDGGSTWRMASLPASLGYEKLTAIKLTTDHSFFAFASGSLVINSPDLGATLNTEKIFGSPEVYIEGVWYDPQHGALAVGGDGEIEQSLDAGETWTALNLCVATGNQINFGDSIIYGIGGYSGNAFCSTRNSGQTWHTYVFQSNNWIGLWFDSPDTGTVLNGYDLKQSLKTTDGGLTWSNAGFQYPFGRWIGYSVFTEKGNTAYLLPGGDSIYATTDHASSWMSAYVAPVLNSPFPNAKLIYHGIRSVAIVNDSIAFALVRCTDSVGNFKFNYHSRYYRTVNAGHTWSEMSSAPATPPSSGEQGSLCFLNPRIGIIACDSGVIYRTSDSGRTWQREILAGPGDVMGDVSFIGDTAAFCSGGGTLFRSTDAGITWIDDSMRIPFDGNPLDQSVFVSRAGGNVVRGDSNTLWALGTLYRRALRTESNIAIVNVDIANPIQYLYIHSYPNPVAIQLRIQLDGMYVASVGTLSCGLYDILGREVRDFTLLAQQGDDGYTSSFVAQVSDLPNGVYILRYRIGTVSYGRQVVILH